MRLVIRQYSWPFYFLLFCHWITTTHVLQDWSRSLLGRVTRNGRLQEGVLPLQQLKAGRRKRRRSLLCSWGSHVEIGFSDEAVQLALLLAALSLLTPDYTYASRLADWGVGHITGGCRSANVCYFCLEKKNFPMMARTGEGLMELCILGEVLL